MTGPILVGTCGFDADHAGLLNCPPHLDTRNLRSGGILLDSDSCHGRLRNTLRDSFGLPHPKARAARPSA